MTRMNVHNKTVNRPWRQMVAQQEEATARCRMGGDYKQGRMTAMGKGNLSAKKIG